MGQGRCIHQPSSTKQEALGELKGPFLQMDAGTSFLRALICLWDLGQKGSRGIQGSRKQRTECNVSRSLHLLSTEQGRISAVLCSALLCSALSASPKGRDAQQLPVGCFPLVSHQANCSCGHSEAQRVVTTGPWHTAGKSARCEMQQLAASAEHQMPSAMAVCCRHGGHIHGIAGPSCTPRQ